MRRYEKGWEGCGWEPKGGGERRGVERGERSARRAAGVPCGHSPATYGQGLECTRWQHGVLAYIRSPRLHLLRCLLGLEGYTYTYYTYTYTYLQLTTRMPAWSRRRGSARGQGCWPQAPTCYAPPSSPSTCNHMCGRL